MRLYAGPAKQFVSDTVRNQVADKVREGFIGYSKVHRTNPGPCKEQNVGA